MVVVAARSTPHRIMSARSVGDGQGEWFVRVCLCGWRSSPQEANTMGRNRSSVEVKEHWDAVGFIGAAICWTIE
jgi:hypothetical protein